MKDLPFLCVEISVTPRLVTAGLAGSGVGAAVAGATVVESLVADAIGVEAGAARAVGVGLVSDSLGVVVVSLRRRCDQCQGSGKESYGRSGGKDDLVELGHLRS